LNTKNQRKETIGLEREGKKKGLFAKKKKNCPEGLHLGRRGLLSIPAGLRMQKRKGRESFGGGSQTSPESLSSLKRHGR